MTLATIILLLIGVETDYRYPAPVGDNGKAVGVLQTHGIMVNECNRLVGEQRWTLVDRESQEQSVAMAEVFLEHQRKRYFRRYGVAPSAFTLMQSWNTGDIFKQAPASYRRRINRFIGTTNTAQDAGRGNG